VRQRGGNRKRRGYGRAIETDIKRFGGGKAVETYKRVVRQPFQDSEEQGKENLRERGFGKREFMR
jgi:hypothetical protein